MPSKMRNAMKRIRSLGLVGAARYAMRRIDAAICLRRHRLKPALDATDFRIEPHELPIADRPYGFHIATNTHEFGAFRDIVKKHIGPAPGDVFLDYGSGAGKALLMAATFPFQRIIGVEFSGNLAATATGVIDAARPRLRCQDIQVVNADATQYELPDDVTVLYFFNPFWGTALEQTLENVHRSLLRRPRTLRILCRHPENFAPVAAACAWLETPVVLHYPESIFIFHVYTHHPSPVA